MARPRSDDEAAWTSESSSEEEAASEFEADSHDVDDEASPTFRLGGRTILWLCQEGQIPLARKRFEWLVQESSVDRDGGAGTGTTTISTVLHQLEKEIFQTGRDKNYPLHEVLMGGTSDSNAYQLTLQLVQYSSQHHPEKFRDMLSARPPSHQRTALHWAAWGNAKLQILQLLVLGYPEALVMRDKASHGNRTPYDLLRHYYHSTRNDSDDPRDTSRLQYLDERMQSWTRHRLRLSVHMSVLRYFAPVAPSNQQSTTTSLTPFDKNHRKNSKMRPKAWFVLSVLGSLVQREMKPLAIHILEFLGKHAAIATATKKSKRVAAKRHNSNSKRTKFDAIN